jgi:hypothetical protein
MVFPEEEELDNDNDADDDDDDEDGGNEARFAPGPKPNNCQAGEKLET